MKIKDSSVTYPTQEEENTGTVADQIYSPIPRGHSFGLRKMLIANELAYFSSWILEGDHSIVPTVTQQ